MNVKELKEKLENVSDDIEVKMFEECGYLIDVADAFIEQDIDEKVFVISH